MAFGRRLITRLTRASQVYPKVVLDLVGFWFPFFVSADIVVILGFRLRKHRITRLGLIKYVGLILWISIITDILFLGSGNRAGLPQGSVPFLILLSTLSYGVLFFRSKPVLSSVFECYVVGVYAEILSDFARSFIVPVSFSPVYWGGDGINDLIFQLGYLMAILYLPSALIPTLIYAVDRRKLGIFIEKLIGKRALDWGSVETH